MAHSKRLISFGNLFCLMLILVSLFSCNRKTPIDFSTQVKPILNSKCISCHGGVKKQGGFSLLFENEALAKLKSGKFGIVPGHPEQSEMIRRLTLSDPEERMPYQEEKLSQEEIRILRQWIKEGAHWGEHWAYQPVQKQNPPPIDFPWGTNAMDKFIAQKILEKGLKPSPQADAHTLARRLALDLIGFSAPDSLKKEYLHKPTLKNYEKLVDQLLASPHFGEKWASMWLDLARYADTKGYERDPDRQIWRYRDWLIKAFNQDMPYDRFITEQLAGDLLPTPSDDQYLATAFHRNTMTNDEGGTDNEEFRTAAVLDRVNTTWEVLLSTSFACVQCHSHPYDPFKHKEYYQFAAFFNNTRDEDTEADYPLLRHYSAEQAKDLKQVETWMNTHASKEEKEEIVRFIKTLAPARNSLTTDRFVNAELSDTKWLLLRNNASARLKAVDLNGKNKLILSLMVRKPQGLLEIRLDHPKGKVIASKVFPEKTNGWSWEQKEIPITATQGVHDVYFTYRHPQQSDDPEAAKEQHLLFDWFYFSKDLPGKGKEGYIDISQIFWNLIGAKVPTTPIMIENPRDLRRATHVFERGNWLVKGEKVSPTVPASLNPFPQNAPKNRLGLARWMTSVDNPLTSRTIVNRIWEQIFGFGLVETLEDMGTQGAEPTHRELLDYLSWELMHNYRWSLKKLIKTIVMSETYRQSSVTTREHLEKDSRNQYLARMPRVRLSAEQIRDQALWISGAFNPEMYGPPVMPYQPNGVWASPYNGAKWQKSEGSQQYRRAIYTYWKRTAPYPSMITFDGIGREVCASRRIRTNTPLQALVTLNDSVYFDLSTKLAERVSTLTKDPKNQISKAYEIAVGKPISADKLRVLLEFYQKTRQNYQQNTRLAQAVHRHNELKNPADLAALALVANAIINLDEVITKN